MQLWHRLKILLGDDVMVIYKFLENGAFVAGDTLTRITGYAYQTSINARLARQNPLKIASEMVRQQNGYQHILDEYNAQNWELIR